VWEVATGKAATPDPLVPLARAARVRFSPHGDVLTVSTGSEYHAFRTKTWELLRSIRRQPAVGTACPPVYSSDGHTLAVVTGSFSVTLLDAATWDPLVRLPSPDGEHLLPLTFTPDGTRLVVSTSDGLVHLWDLRLIREQLREPGLDWDQQSYPPAPPTQPPVRVEMVR
jgi:WD40 repeat protein